MDNFILGIQALAYGINLTIGTILQLELFWGFAIGFFVSTLIHAFLISEHPRNIPKLLFYDIGTSFQQLSHRAKNGTYTSSFSHFMHMAETVKLLFALSFLLSMLIIFLALIRF